MKEATGELNMTVVTVVAIAALMAFFYLIIWPTIKTGLTLTSACSASNGDTYTMTDKDGNSVTCGGGSCTFTDADSGSTNQKQCTQSKSSGGE